MCTRAETARRAFTLIELLVVIIIIAIVISIVLPALAGARTAARAADTKANMNRLIQASSVFQGDNSGRLPGYFTTRDMGVASNEDRGMSMTENMLLDLAGGITGTGGSNPGNSVQVGPKAAGQIWVDPSLQGVQSASNKAYFVPDKKYMVAQTNDGASLQKQYGVPGHTDNEGNPQLPDLVDAFGQPLLAWVQDDTALRPVNTIDDFVRVNSGTGDQVSRYYWASNAAFLRSNSLGKKANDQTQVAGSDQYSLIGKGVTPAEQMKSLAGILGNPNFPHRNPADPPTTIPTLPDAGRAPLILHSAGADGFYFGSRDRGAKQFAPPNHTIEYKLDFATVTGQGYTDKNGNPTNIDVTEQFDDLMLSGGN